MTLLSTVLYPEEKGGLEPGEHEGYLASQRKRIFKRSFRPGFVDWDLVRSGATERG